MDKTDYLKDIYNDFFSTDKSIEDSSNEIKLKEDGSSLSFEIDKLYISDDAKNIIKKIIDYMKKYNNNEVDIYIPLRLIINSNSDKLSNDIIDIIYNAAVKYSYIDKKEKIDYSLYKIDKNISFANYGLINFKDLSGINLEDDKTHKKMFYELENYFDQDNKSIITVVGNDLEITNFFLGYENFKNKYFKFNIDSVNPDNQDIYNDIINSIDVNDDLKVALLDYINKTYDKNSDYYEYEKEIIRYISFHNELPSIKEELSNDEIFKELDELVGLDKVKKVLHDLVDLMRLKSKTENELKISNINLHMVFLGNPGTGKTTIARMIANILYNLKYIKENKLIEVSSKDLVAEYVGQTAPKVASVIEKSLNGVLFIDEAYTLASNSSNSYNDEAIATLIQAMENYRDKLVVIFAGYTKEMQDFLNSNSGITSRIGYTLEFDDYTTMELIQIFENMAKKSGFKVEDSAIEYLKTIVDDNRNMKNFGNARFIRNIYEKTIVSHASRVKDKKNKKDLITITKDDINTENLILK